MHFAFCTAAISQEFWHREDFSRLESLGSSIWVRSHPPSGLCVCVCVQHNNLPLRYVSAGHVCLRVRASNADKVGLVTPERSRVPCCPKYSETLLFFSQTLRSLRGHGGRPLWVYLERVLSDENSAPCPLICMDFYGMCLHVHGTFVSLGRPRSRLDRQRPNS